MSTNMNPSQPEGNFYNKYDSNNPIERFLMKRFYRAFYRALDHFLSARPTNSPPPRLRILDAGCGEGRLSALVLQYLEARGVETEYFAFDASEAVIAEAQRRFPQIHFSVGDIYAPQTGRFDLVLCSEVLEHLERPQQVVRQAQETADFLLASVPREPLWRAMNMARGAYWNALGNTPGHIQHWSARGFRRMLRENGFSPLFTACPLPWTVVLCRRNSAV